MWHGREEEVEEEEEDGEEEEEEEEEADSEEAEVDSDALKAALTSWPRVVLVRMERRWRGLKEGVGAVMMEDGGWRME